MVDFFCKDRCVGGKTLVDPANCAVGATGNININTDTLMRTLGTLFYRFSRNAVNPSYDWQTAKNFVCLHVTGVGALTTG